MEPKTLTITNLGGPQTLTITNLGGPLTRRRTGDINSGLSRFETSWGYDPYSKPGNLTWMEQPSSILTLTGSAGPIVAMKQRSESSGNRVYAIANNRNLYQVTLNSGSSPGFELDTPSVIGTLIDMGSDAMFENGGDIKFYGSTEKIWSSSRGIQKINFDGSGVTSIAGTEASGIPRPMETFLGKLYYGNANNIGEIDSTELLVTATKLNPALPSGLYVSDLDVTPDGNYLQITATRNRPDLNFNPLGTAQPDQSMSESYKFFWNGIDEGVTAGESYPGIQLTASEIIGENNNTFGYGQSGLDVLLEGKKDLTLPNNLPPFPGATFGASNMLGFATIEYVPNDTRYRGVVYNYGQYDKETQSGLYRLLRFNAATSGSDVVVIQSAKNVSNYIHAHPYRAIPGSVAASGKMYITTTEASALGSPVGPHRILKFFTNPVGVGSIVAGTYETQTQLFSKKIKVGEVRFYTEPLVGGNDFTIDLIGSGGSVMANGSQRFQVATGSIATGTDMIQFNPAMAPTYALGIRITNSSITGVANWTGNKIEIDYSEGGT